MRASVVLTLLWLASCECSPIEPRCIGTAECAAGFWCVDGRCRRAVDASIDTPGLDAPDVPAPRPDTGPPVGSGCSADLRDVLADGGGVILTCPEDQGCSEGRCIPACEAAARSRGTIACEFAVSSPPAYPPALPPCLAAFIANTWATPAHLTVTRGTTTLDVTSFGRLVDNASADASTWAPVPSTGVPPGAVAVLFLSSDPNSVMPENGVDLSCPITPAIDAATVIDATGRGPAFHISADVPVRGYDILPYGGARSHFPGAQLLLPLSTWGTEYALLGPPAGTHDPAGPFFFHMLGGPRRATVSIVPPVALAGGGGVPAAPASTPTMLTIEPYEVVQYESGTADPSGTLIRSDEPIGVVGGTRFLRLQPTALPGGEAVHHAVLPANALASLYVAAPYETRRADLMPEVVPYRIVGVVDGTMLTTDPAIPGAPTSLSQGQVVDFTTASGFVIESQDAMHPFALAQFMPTANTESGSRPGCVAPTTGPFEQRLGDEEMVMVFPPAQFLSSYLFFTDPTYPTTNLVLVRARRMDGTFAPVRVDCLGEVTGFRAVGTSGEYEMASVDLLRAGVGAGTPACANGAHSAESDGAFGITVWGLDTYSSYAYPGGGNAAVLAELPPLF